MLAAQTVYFELDRSDIKLHEREKLKAVKAYLDKNPTHRLSLEGYCDWRGTAEYNIALGGSSRRFRQEYSCRLRARGQNRHRLAPIAVPLERQAMRGILSKYAFTAFSFSRSWSLMSERSNSKYTVCAASISRSSLVGSMTWFFSKSAGSLNPVMTGG